MIARAVISSRSIVIACAFGAVVAACSALTSLDDLRGTTSDAAGESAVEASGGDGGLPWSDGAAFCSSFGQAHTFCSDWDEPSAGPATAWNNTWVVSGVAGVTNAPIVTPPGALAAFLPDAGSGLAMSAVAKTFASVTNLHCAFDMYVVQTSTGQVGFADFFFDGIGGSDMEPAIDGTGMVAMAAASSNTPIQTITLGRWHHFDWTIARNASTAAATLVLDGAQAYFNAQVLSNIPASTTTMGVSLGFSGEGSRDWVIAYDDLICDAQ